MNDRPGLSNRPPQGRVQSLPPTWEQFSKIEVSKQQQIYNTMCDQIQSQQKQLIGLVEKLKNDPQASQRLQQINNSAEKQKLEDENRRLKNEIENIKKVGSSVNSESNAKEIQLQTLMTKTINEKEILLQKFNQAKDESDATIAELNQRVHELEMMIRQQQDVNSSAQKIHQLETQNSELKSQINDYRMKYEQLGLQYNQVKSEYDMSFSQLDQYKRQIDSLAQYEQRYKIIQQELKNSQEEGQRQNKELERINNDLLNENQEKKRIQVELQSVLQRLIYIYLQRMNKLKEMETLETQFNDIYSDFQSIKSQYGQQNQKIKDYETVIEELIAENSRLILDLCNIRPIK